MSSMMTFGLFKPILAAAHRSAGSQQNLGQHCTGQSQAGGEFQEERAKCLYRWRLGLELNPVRQVV
jgi:hypothetical protein